MSRVDVHPEDLLDAARDGALDPADQRRLASHLAHCTACAIEYLSIDDFLDEGAAQPDDAALIARLVDDAAAVVVTGYAAQPDPEPVPSTRRRRTVAIAAGALAIGLLSGAAAAFFAMKSFAPDPEPADPAPAQAEGTHAVATRELPPVIVEPEAMDEDLTPEIVPPDIVPLDIVALEEVDIEANDVEPPAATGPTEAAPSAAELLEQANAERRAGRANEAVQTYRRLQRLHPGSREASSSRVSLGRLLLDRVGDSAGALRQFDGYLRSQPGGVLAEEARVGRALALGRLGRAAEERAAWEDLLARHPSSPHAARARQRLGR